MALTFERYFFCLTALSTLLMLHLLNEAFIGKVRAG
jgi:hypothetical protein